MGAPTLSCQLVHISSYSAGVWSRLPISASISEPEIGLPPSVPLPLPYCDDRSVAISLSSVAAPSVVGGGRTRQVRYMSLLRFVLALSPGTPMSLEDSIQYSTDFSAPPSLILSALSFVSVPIVGS